MSGNWLSSGNNCSLPVQVYVIWFDGFTSLMGSRFDDCMSGFSGYTGVYCRVFNPGFTEPENPGKTRKPGFGMPVNPGFSGLNFEICTV